MERNQSSYWQHILDGRLSRRRAIFAAAGALAGLGALTLAGCSDDGDEAQPTATAAPPKGELVVLNNASPHVAVYDAETRQLKRSADIPNIRRWSWNDDNNYFDGQNLWLALMTPVHGAPDFDGNEVILLNLDTLGVTTRIPMGKEGTMENAMTGVSNAMLNIGRHSRDGRVFIGKMFQGEVVAVDARSRSVVATKRIGGNDDWACDSDLGLAADGRERLYVATNMSGKLLSLDARTLDVQQTYTAPAGVRPFMVTVAPDSERVWVQNTFAMDFSGERLGLTVFDAKTLAVLKHFDTGRSPVMNTFSPDGKLSYVAHGNGGYASVYDATTLAEVTKIEVAGTSGMQIAVHPDGSSIFVRSNLGSESAIFPVATANWQTGEKFGSGPAMSAQSGVFMRRLA